MLKFASIRKDTVMKTYMAKKGEIKRAWFVANADGAVLGRLATRVATILTGKHKPVYTPHVDTGDYVIILNADKIHVTGNRRTDKMYSRYSGYPGGLRRINFETLMQHKPKEVVRLAVKNMLPKSKLGKDMFKKLKLYKASEKPNVPKGAKEMKI